MKVRIVLFAAAREIVGSSRMDLSLDDASTVGDLKFKLRELYPGLTGLMEKSTFSVDQQYVRDENPLFHGAEVGLIPPVSGG